MLSVVDTAWTGKYMLTCPSKRFLYLDCPGCGLQRSAWALFHGEFATSWSLYPPTIFILATLAFLVLHLSIGFSRGAYILKILFIITVGVMAVNYIYKILNHQLI
ncbi:MAG: DUF2752 domain-containing protein [Taibaiella sp.]|nr:DUF2752 domain-containing protein [Taibaiella sp.]